MTAARPVRVVVPEGRAMNGAVYFRKVVAGPLYRMLEDVSLHEVSDFDQGELGAGASNTHI